MEEDENSWEEIMSRKCEMDWVDVSFTLVFAVLVTLLD